MRRHPRLNRLVAVACAVALSLSGCGSLADQSATPPGSGGVADSSDARSALAGLTVSTWDSMTGYDRDHFRHWIAQGDGCDTREAVLAREGSKVTTAKSCEITAGEWFSEYDGVTVDDPRQLDIDHMVPLANAWRTGAKRWTEEQREAFANDVTRPQLLAVTARTNRAKGDQDPSQWRPPRHDYWCVYAQRWIQVKSHWRLTVTVAEKGSLTEMLGTC